MMPGVPYICAILIVVAVTGCPVTATVSGGWEVPVASQVSVHVPHPLVVSLSHSGTAPTGGVFFTNAPSMGTETISGMVTGATEAFGISFGDQVAGVTVLVDESDNTMDGTYKVTGNGFYTLTVRPNLELNRRLR